MFDMRALYEIALEEREGLGTAYEYYVKLRLLNRFAAPGRPKSILILGLPERYGFSMDFLRFAGRLGARVTVLDERPERLEEHARIADRLVARGLLSAGKVDRRAAADWASAGEQYDLGLSCEVLQRLGPEAREAFARTLAVSCRQFAVFAPNAGNAAHVGLSGLKTVAPEDLVGLLRSAGAAPEDSGLLDCPPFPPGLHMIAPVSPGSGGAPRSGLSDGLKKQVMRSVAPFLTPFAHLERRYPSSVRSRYSHIVWAVGGKA